MTIWIKKSLHKRNVAVAVLMALLQGTTGCSFILTRAPNPQTGDPTGAKFCTPSKAWPVTDAVIGGIGTGVGSLTMAAGVIGTVVPSQQSEPTDPALFLGLGAGLLTTGVLALVSSGVGFGRQKRCSAAVESAQASGQLSLADSPGIRNEGRERALIEGDSTTGGIHYRYDRFKERYAVSFEDAIGLTVTRGRLPLRTKVGWYTYGDGEQGCWMSLQTETSRWGMLRSQPELYLRMNDVVERIGEGSYDGTVGNKYGQLRTVETLFFGLNMSQCASLLGPGDIEGQLGGIEFKTHDKFRRFGRRVAAEIEAGNPWVSE